MTDEIKNWEGYKEKILEGLSEKQSKMVGIVMENAHQENVKGVNQENPIVISESTSVGSTVTSNISRYDMLFMPLIRRTMPALLANDLVGVQPLKASRGIVRTLRFRYSETTDDTNGGTPVVTAGDEASGMNVYEKYSLLVRTGDYDDVDALNPFQQTVYLEGNIGKPMNLDVVTDAVDSKSRKLSAAYSLEAADDLAAYDGLDIEAELTTSLGDEILREKDREVITTLTSLAGTVESFDFAVVDGRYAGEKLAALTIAIDQLSTEIAIKTKKSGANWMVVSPRVFTALKNASNTTFVPVNNFAATNGGNLQISSSLFVGTFGGFVKVYVDPYAETDTVLMGYKGSELDTGLIYAPYIPLASSGVIRNPETGDHRILLRTRYALHSFTNTATSLGNSADFYARASIANLQLGFTN